MTYLKLFAIAAFAIAAILYLASAEDHRVISGNQDYDPGEYVKISVNTIVHVKVTSGQAYDLDVRADGEDLNRLKIYVRGRTLVIENREDMFNLWQGPRPEIAISLPMLKKFTLNGSSDAEIAGIHGRFFTLVINGSGAARLEGASDELQVEINGSGSVESSSYDASQSGVDINGSGSVDLSGSCHRLEVEINGSGNFAGRNFICEQAQVDVSGSGDLDIYASRRVDVNVTGSGKVDIYGKPAQVRDRSRKKSHVTMR